jgi:hypothetical protein
VPSALARGENRKISFVFSPMFSHSTADPIKKPINAFFDRAIDCSFFFVVTQVFRVFTAVYLHFTSSVFSSFLS